MKVLLEEKLRGRLIVMEKMVVDLQALRLATPPRSPCGVSQA
jgi:hypothetical protein